MTRSRDLSPLRATSAEPGSPEAAAKALLDAQPPIVPLSRRTLATLRARIDARAKRPAGDWRVVAWAAAGALLLATTSIAWARPGSVGERLRETARQVLDSAIASVVHREPKATARRSPEVPSGQPLESALTPAPEAKALAPPERGPVSALGLATADAPALARPAPREGSTAGVRFARPLPAIAPIPTATPASALATAAPATYAAPSALALEAQSLREIAELLRTHDGAPSALEKLALHRQRFPQGALSEEADLAELDADALLGRRPQALSLLTGLERRGGPRPDELRVLHGELLAAGGDCQGALSHWGPTVPAEPDLAERLLYGRASCLSTLGRTAESREAMSAYLARFPSGRFAAALRAALPDRVPAP